MKKISFIIPSFEVGGIESSFINAANFLKGGEFEPELVYWFEGGKLKKQIDPDVIITKLKVSNLFSFLIILIVNLKSNEINSEKLKFWKDL